jgi:hypothetical protein
VIAVSFTRVSGFSRGMPFHCPMIVWLEEPIPMTKRPGRSCAITFTDAAITAGVRVYTGVTATPMRTFEV